MHDIHNFIFNGGGFRGIAFVGALTYLEEQGITIKNIKSLAGTSVGSIVSLLYICNYTSKELYDEICSFSLRDLTSISILRLLQQYGLDDGEKVMQWLRNLVKRKGFAEDISFSNLKELTGKTFYVTVTNINDKKTEILSHISHPNLPVLKAIRMSISLPFIYTPVKMNGKLYGDGALTCNFPLYLYETEKDNTLGFYLTEMKDDNKINDIYKYGHNVLKCINNKKKQENMYDFPYIVKIATDKKHFLNFKMTDKQKKNIFDLGYDCAKKLLLEKKNKE